ncbi:hypothetical protein SprV_0902777100 [Sparganum proliferum]
MGLKVVAVNQSREANVQLARGVAVSQVCAKEVRITPTSYVAIQASQVGFLRENYDETDQQLKRVHFIELLELCPKTFFTFNSQVYEQKKRTPMGSLLSGLIVEAVLQRLERLVFSSYPPKFWARYVDDTFVIIKRSDVQTFKALLE